MFTRIEQWSLLALLRFGLAFIVAINHLGEQVDLGPLAVVPKFGAFEAVLGFLLISGYSVGSSWLKAPQGFFVRRCKRLYPVYLAAMAVTIVVTPPPVFNASWRIALLVNLLFLNQVLSTTSLVGPAWSLSLEFWLYALIPVFDRLSDRRLRQWVGLSFLTYVIYTVGRTLLHWPYYSGLGWALNLPLLGFAWVCGFRLVKFKDRRQLVLKDIAALFAAHLLLGALIQLGFRLKHGELPLFWTQDAAGYGAAGVTLALVWSVFRWRVGVAAQAATRRSAAMILLGDVSYPLYLIHIPVFTLGLAAGVQSPWSLAGLAVLAAAGVHVLVEWLPRRWGR